MIIPKRTPFTLEEIELLKEQFDVYIKTVIDLETSEIDFNSFINIRPRDKNPKLFIATNGKSALTMFRLKPQRLILC